MRLQIHDPGHVALRRAVRSAIGVPVTAALALLLLPKSPAAIISVFGSLCLLGLCDFGGPARRRLTSLLGAGAVGAVLVTVGVLASQNTVTAVIVTLVVGTCVAFAPLLHGSVASGAMAMTVMYVVAITAEIPMSEWWKPLVGWALALVIAIPVTLLILPRRNLAPVRQACAAALRAFADAVEARGRGESPDVAALDAAQDALRRSYLGNPFRAAGLNSRDRTLLALAGQLQGLLATVSSGRAYPTPASSEEVTGRLITQSAEALRAAGSALLDPGAPAPSGLPIVADWRAQWDAAVSILTTGDAAEQPVDDVAALFPDRAMAVASVRVVMLVRRVLGAPDEPYPSGPDIPSIPAPPVPRGREDLRAQATLRSPWARLALRTGLGLAIAVAVVSVTGLSHGLWVVLGVTSVLRMDSLTTLKTALLAVLGTFLGAAVGYVILAVDSTQITWLWPVLVAATFLAVWLPGAVGFFLGQAAFSVFVITAFTLLTWPPDVSTAAERFEDVAVGAIVSIVVALLLWPRGVMSGVIANVSEAVRTSSKLLREAVTSLVVGGSVEPSLPSDTTAAMVRSQEVMELSLSSPQAGAAQTAYEWQGVIDHLRMPTVAGTLLSQWAALRTPVSNVVPQAADPLMTELDSVLREWQGVADEIDGAPTRESVPEPATLASIADLCRTVDTRDPVVADQLVAAVWCHGWLRMALLAGRSCHVPVRN